MFYTYKTIYTTGNAPDLTQVNTLAQEGWELLQIGQSTSEQLTGNWYYLLQREAMPPDKPQRLPS